MWLQSTTCLCKMCVAKTPCRCRSASDFAFVQCKTPGEVLQKLRLECDLVQQAVADALDIHRATYSYHEMGRTSPDIQRIGELAKIYGIPAEVLVELLADPSKAEAIQESVPNPRKARATPSGGKIFDLSVPAL